MAISHAGEDYSTQLTRRLFGKLGSGTVEVEEQVQLEGEQFWIPLENLLNQEQQMQSEPEADGPDITVPVLDDPLTVQELDAVLKDGNIHEG